MRVVSSLLTFHLGLVPGQDIHNLNWFWAITGSLVLFAVTSYFIAKRVYGIV
jgi:magnesium transporter